MFVTTNLEKVQEAKVIYNNNGRFVYHRQNTGAKIIIIDYIHCASSVLLQKQKIILT